MKAKNHIQFPSTLRELYSHRDFIPFGSSSDDWINDRERMSRCSDAAEHGAEGSTHAEIIGDWREFLSRLESDAKHHCLWHPRIEAEIERRAALIHAEIDACEEWHASAGSLHEEIG
jgi:hypothetical protein